MRDHVVYGKLDKVHKLLSSLPKEDEDDDVMVLQRLISDVYTYLRVILTMYIRDKDFVEPLMEH